MRAGVRVGVGEAATLLEALVSAELLGVALREAEAVCAVDFVDDRVTAAERAPDAVTLTLAISEREAVPVRARD